MHRRHLILSGLALAIGGLAAPELATAQQTQKKKGGGLDYIQFDTLTATVIRPNGRRGVLTVEAGINVPDAKLRQRATLDLPRLLAAYVQWVTSYAASLGAGQPPNADYMAASLQRETDRVLGQTGAHLLLGDILVN